MLGPSPGLALESVLPHPICPPTQVYETPPLSGPGVGTEDTAENQRAQALSAGRVFMTQAALRCSKQKTIQGIGPFTVLGRDSRGVRGRPTLRLLYFYPHLLWPPPQPCSMVAVLEVSSLPRMLPVGSKEPAETGSGVPRCPSQLAGLLPGGEGKSFPGGTRGEEPSCQHWGPKRWGV